MRLNDIRISPHFKLREFQCGCCGTVKLRPELIAMLEALRALWGRPISLTSGYRCEQHNRAVGGASRSLHMAGRAADISARPDEQKPLRLYAFDAGFTEVICGEEKNYIHVGFN
ncbi:MAG: peptidase M15 [Synergistaceae bacterium]|jgi:hypothetical protein|nr:peptidase M15 [Synergistaceae bacterium]